MDADRVYNADCMRIYKEIVGNGFTMPGGLDVAKVFSNALVKGLSIYCFSDVTITEAYSPYQLISSWCMYSNGNFRLILF